MKKYRCHKVVQAAKITNIIEAGGSMTLEFDGGEKVWFPPEDSFPSRHALEVGGYYVVYEDGYRSFSPAKAFEAGYTLIEE